MRHQFITLFRGSIERYRVVHLVLRGVRNLLVAAIDRGGRGIEQMLYLVVAACLQDIVESYKVALDISIRIGDAVADSCLSGKVHDNGNLVFREDFLYCIFVCNGGMDKCPDAMQSLYFLQTLILDVDIVVVGNGIDADNLDIPYFVEKTLDEVATDKAGSARHEDGFVLEIYVILYHIFCLCL